MSPEQFRRVLDWTCAVVGGSVAIHFLEGQPQWQPRNMDIYLPHWSYYKVLQYLIQDEGYSIMSLVVAALSGELSVV